MIYSLLEEAQPTNQWVSYVLIGVLVVVLIGSMIIMNRRSKKREQEAQKLIDAVKPGNKVKTIGGICGIVVEVNPEDDTFVLETGSETSGKCFMKFVRQAILESDAVVEEPAKIKKEEKTEEAAEQPAEVKEVAEQAEAPAQEPVIETAPAEEKKEEKKKTKNNN